MNDEFGEENDVQEDIYLDPNNPDDVYTMAEQEFTRAIAEIEQNPQTAYLSEKYNRLFELLFNANETRKELVNKCTQLEEKVASDAEKLKIARKLANADTDLISTLKHKIDLAWKLADTAHDREQQAQEIIDNLRKQIHALTVELDFKNKMGSDNADEAGQMSKQQESLEREKDRLLGEVTQMQQKLVNAMGYQEELERKNSQADFRINEIAGQLEDQAEELITTRKHRDRLDDEVRTLTTDLDKSNADIVLLNSTIQKHEKQNIKLENQVTELKGLWEKLTKDMEALTLKHSKLQDQLLTSQAQHEDLTKKLSKLTLELKLKEEENVKMRSEVHKSSNLREFYDKKISKMEQEKNSIAMERDKIRQLYVNVEKEIDQFKRHADGDRRTIEGMNREKDILNKTILKQQALVGDHVKLIKIQEQTKKKLETEINHLHSENLRQIKNIDYLEKERDRLVDEQLDLTAKVEDAMDDIKMKKAEIYDLKKDLVENETKLRMQQNLFEGVRAERNALQKSLQESNAECGDFKNKLRITTHQTEQLKEDIAAKEQELIRAENILRKMTKEKENLRIELDNAQDFVKQLRKQVAEMSSEEKRLCKVILDSERTIRQLSKNLEQLMNERDILGSQLVRRNDELALLYEKIKILQTTLYRGEAHYERRLEDIRLLKIEIKCLRQQKFLLTKSITNISNLRQELFHLERDVTTERLRCRALEEELQNPLNIHRWRKLEGSDPDVLNLLKKIQLLQKRLLQKSTQAIERESKLKETEKLYVNLRQLLARQPSPEVQNELLKTQRALTLRGNKMKCLVAELNMIEQNTVEYKEDLAKVRLELKEWKFKYFAEKKSHEKQLEMWQSCCNSKETNQGEISQIKVSGGGFKMSISKDVKN